MKGLVWVGVFLGVALGLGAQPRWYAPAVLQVGTVNEVYGWNDGPLEPFTVEVLRPRGHQPLAVAPSVAVDTPVPGAPGGPWHWSAALVCLDALDPPGPVTVRIVAADGTVLATLGSALAPHDYPREELSLDKTMSELREQPDPRKDREWARIWQVYSHGDAQAPWQAGHWDFPVAGEPPQSAHFGDTRKYRYVDGATALDYHRGVDFAVPQGTTVVAPAPGRVVLVADRMLTGTSVVLEHGPGVYSVYFHLSQASVQVGQTVTAGQTIALSGATGLVTGPHLHWEVRVNGVPVDPLPLVARGLLDTAAVGKVISSIECLIH